MTWRVVDQPVKTPQTRWKYLIEETYFESLILDSHDCRYRFYARYYQANHQVTIRGARRAETTGAPERLRVILLKSSR